MGLTVHYQRRSDAIARDMTRGSSSVCFPLLDRDLRIRAASRARVEQIAHQLVAMERPPLT
ncbi:hypothetical protein [Mycobacterium alsense]|uniref:hypothetical protein n=1 Tax=Mycobacterium alsense TaxID=324058 RepID=UPI001042084F|nr:hypothetical protein [Mycobacterium alsense]